MGVILAIIGVLLFTLIIFLHEFGHFFTAKLSGISVHEFALGMGPKIFSFTKGETEYSLRALPIGGFCDIEGENGDSTAEGSFTSKPIWKRMIVIITGAIMNLILGVIFMAIVLLSQDLLATTTIADFTEGSKLEVAGIMVNDEIIEIDGYKIYSEKDLSYAFATADASGVDFVVKRDGEKITFDNVELASYTEDGETYVSIDFYVYGEEVNLQNLVTKTFADSFAIARMVIDSLKGLLTGEFSINDVSGPVGATQAIAQATTAGLQDSFSTAFSNLLFMMALISVNLGIFNLLPFPALDGGRFVFLLIELIFKKPVPQKVEGYVNSIGFMILIGFMLLITFKDVWNLFI
ncbi:MAG: M50 family metallopeptidase [Clostridia bacterium]